jgi:hypothetical protein
MKKNTDEQQEYIDNLKEECSKCGEQNKDVLLFHHVDPSKKVCAIGRHLTMDKLQIELRKCIVLCHNCHTTHHRRNGFGTRKEKLPKQSYILTKAGYNITRGKDLYKALSCLPDHLLRDIGQQCSAVINYRRIKGI